MQGFDKDWQRHMLTVAHQTNTRNKKKKKINLYKHDLQVINEDVETLSRLNLHDFELNSNDDILYNENSGKNQHKTTGRTSRATSKNKLQVITQ